MPKSLTQDTDDLVIIAPDSLSQNIVSPDTSQDRYGILRDKIRAVIDHMLTCTEVAEIQGMIREGGMLVEDGHLEAGWRHLCAALREIHTEVVGGMP